MYQQIHARVTAVRLLVLHFQHVSRLALEIYLHHAQLPLQNRFLHPYLLQVQTLLQFPLRYRPPLQRVSLTVLHL